MENLHDRKLKRLVSDRGGKFLNHKFKALSEEHRFQNITSPEETPQHNGFSERANQSILVKTRCISNHSKLPKVYWAEAVHIDTVLSNIVLAPSRSNKSPFSLSRGLSPWLKNIRTFGCQAVIALQKGHREWKFGPYRCEGILLGFENNNTSYHILRTLDKKVIVTWHAKFNEDIFPGIAGPSGDLTVTWSSSNWPTDMVDEPHTAASVLVDEVQTDRLAPKGIESVVYEPHMPQEEVASTPVEAQTSLPSSPRPRIKVIGPWHPTLITSDILEQNILPYSRRANALVKLTSDDLRAFRQALKSTNKDAWVKANNKELGSMANLGVWAVVDLNPCYKLIGTTWVFKTKRNHLGEVFEHKACLCAQGFTQSPGIDYKTTYSPTGLFNSLRTLISFAETNSLSFHQIDVKCAFLNSPLKEMVYLPIPQGFNLAKDRQCFELRKAIYDPCVFHWGGDCPVWLYIHVDDIAIFGAVTSYFKSEISREFAIKDIGPDDLMLGVKVTHSSSEISLDQKHFTDSLLFSYGRQECRPVSTPLLPNENLSPSTKEEVIEFKKLSFNYQSAIGSINYLSMATRTNLLHAVSSLSKFLENPGMSHWKSFLHVLRYLCGSPNLGLVYSRNSYHGIATYSDADWGHSAEAEYKAQCDLASKILWLRQWAQECAVFHSVTPIPVYEDNQSCINAANGDCNINNKHMKLINIQLHFIKEEIRSSIIQLNYTPTSSMLADFLTKSVSHPALSRALATLDVLQLGVRRMLKIISIQTKTINTPSHNANKIPKL
ncbi:hypothetical protein O181_014453 [Austropuccinia psidii MF-1]|uniref:Integrase catalytic domain-containing protein n=1 Tax=Austropuccinia psidii MF-1 TaxID=1389203 RepID=A0A9Q3C0K3_9BASI|nr:hypothetical protein [Austropuccinia psidii MF-1]